MSCFTVIIGDDGRKIQISSGGNDKVKSWDSRMTFKEWWEALGPPEVSGTAYVLIQKAW